MVHNNIVILPHAMPLSSGADHTHETAMMLSKKNIVFVLSLNEPNTWRNLFSARYKKKRVTPYISFHPFLILPGNRNPFIHSCNIFLYLCFFYIYVYLLYAPKQAILWFHEPVYARLVLRVFRNWKSVYDDVDYFSALGNSWRLDEEFLIRHATYITAVSPKLYTKLLLQRKDTVFVPSGFAEMIFRHNNKHTANRIFTVGFVGDIDFRLDYQLLFRVITSCPDLRFVFVGPVGMNEQGKDVAFLADILFSYKNVKHISEQPKKKIPAYISSFDVCIIPYDKKNRFVYYSNPMKTFEYLYSKKPVIATHIPSLSQFREVLYIAHSAKEFIRHIRFVQINGHSTIKQKQGRIIAKQNSWNNKFRKLASYMHAII